MPLTLGWTTQVKIRPSSSSLSWSSMENSTVLIPSDALNLLSISANVVTDEELAQLALQAADSGSVLEGIVVVNPDPSDNTTGFIMKMRSDDCFPVQVPKVATLGWFTWED